MRTLLYIIRTINVLKTLWFNFKVFPFAVAKKLPVWLYGKVTFRSLTGKIVINGPVTSGMIKIGKNDHYVDTAIQQCIWNVRGTLIFNGPAIFGHGSYVVISDNATLEFGERESYFGTNLKIFCFDRIVIGSNVKLIVAGEFYGNPDPYHKQIKDLGIEDRVILCTDFIPDGEVNRYFSAADIVAQPYKTATQSGVTQIAFHFEKPMLVTNVGGLPEIVPDGKIGYVVEPDAKQIADALHRFFQEQKQEEFERNVAEEKKKYAWSRFVEVMGEVIHE